MPQPEREPGTDHPSPFRRAVRNFGRLLRGRGFAAILELITITVMARVLTPANLGFIVLIQSYALFIRGLLQFNMYEVLVRFGVPLLESGDETAFRRLLRLTVAFDIGSSFAATALAMAAAPLAAWILGWGDGVARLAVLYSIVLLIYGYGTAKGILRIFDRYDLLGWQLMVGPALRLAGVSLAVWLNPTVLTFVVVMTLATIAGDACLITLAWFELRRRKGLSGFRGLSLRGWQQHFPGLRGFAGIVYWQSNLDMVPKYLSTLLAGVFLGPAAAGYLRLANEATKVLSKPGALIGQVVFPDLVRMWLHRSMDFGAMLKRALAISALVGAAFIAAAAIGGRPLFARGLGEAYAQAAPLLILMFMATTMDLMSNVLRTAGYAMGHAGKILRLHLVGAIIYLLSFVLLTPPVGLLGPGLAACLGAVAPLAGIGWIVFRTIREARLQAV